MAQSLQERLAVPLQGPATWQGQWEQWRHAAAALQAAHEEKARERRGAMQRDLVAEFAGADYVPLGHYRDLAEGELAPASAPALEYFHRTGEMRLCNVLDLGRLHHLALVQALALRLDGAPDTGPPPLVDVLPREGPPIEHGDIVLGPHAAFLSAAGTRWRIFLVFTYDGPAGGCQTRHVIAEGIL